MLEMQIEDAQMVRFFHRSSRKQKTHSYDEVDEKIEEQKFKAISLAVKLNAILLQQEEVFAKLEDLDNDTT
jgi:hypothetical protein